jgi:hypothetical protein
LIGFWVLGFGFWGKKGSGIEVVSRFRGMEVILKIFFWFPSSPLGTRKNGNGGQCPPYREIADANP